MGLCTERDINIRYSLSVTMYGNPGSRKCAEWVVRLLFSYFYFFFFNLIFTLVKGLLQGFSRTSEGGDRNAEVRSSEIG